MRNVLKSEIIFEVAGSLNEKNGFSKIEKLLPHNIKKNEINITNKDMAIRIDREVGNYVSFNFDETLYFDTKARQFLSSQLAQTIKTLASSKVKKILVVGLGNNLFACDRLGTIVANNIFITKPYLDKGLFSANKLAQVYSICTGVYGTTGLDSCDVVKAVCNCVLPDVVIVVDSMVCQDPKRLALSVQLSNTKLLPGGGVGNIRKEISLQTIGVPIVAIGVPFVVNTKTICKNADNLEGVIAINPTA